MKTHEMESRMRDVMRQTKMIKSVATLESRIERLAALVESIAKVVQELAARGNGRFY